MLKRCLLFFCFFFPVYLPTQAIPPLSPPIYLKAHHLLGRTVSLPGRMGCPGLGHIHPHEHVYQKLNFPDAAHTFSLLIQAVSQRGSFHCGC